LEALNALLISFGTFGASAQIMDGNQMVIDRSLGCVKLWFTIKEAQNIKEPPKDIK
jgi:hypothetical protein